MWTGQLSGSGVTRPSTPVAGGRPGHLHLGPSLACGVTCLPLPPTTYRLLWDRDYVSKNVVTPKTMVMRG